jgi:DNA-directed RNA polymerase specialized sigma24 family protein
MSRVTEVPQELDLPSGQTTINNLNFNTLYDQYAPALFGVITKTVLNEGEAAALLEKIFITVHAELSTFRPGKQSVFTWLLTLTRKTIADALQARNKVPSPAFLLTSTGNVTLSPNRTAPAGSFCTDPTDTQLKELLDAVLFKKCTPEEAAHTIGLPVETARQQLRLAMQQIRSQR